MTEKRREYFREYQKKRMKNRALRKKHYQNCKESRDRQTPETRDRRLALMRTRNHKYWAKGATDRAEAKAQKTAKIAARRAKVCELRKLGATLQQIAKMLGICTVTASRDATNC